MICSDFIQKISECRSALEVRRVVLWHQEDLSGTWTEICEALDAANKRAMDFDDYPPVERGCAFVPDNICGVFEEKI